MMVIKIIGSGSSGNCYLVSDNKTSILLDAGLPIKVIQQGCNFQLSGISGCLISHQHGDHIKGARALSERGVDLYASPETLTAGKLEGHRCHPVNAQVPFDIGTFYIHPFDVHHDVRNYGYLLHSRETGDRLLYVTDTYYVDYVFNNLNYIMFECNYSLEAVNESIAKGYIPEELKRRLLHSHMSLDHFIDMLRANDLRHVKAIYLLHLSANNSREAEFKEAVQRAAGCEVYIA